MLDKTYYINFSMTEDVMKSEEKEQTLSFHKYIGVAARSTQNKELKQYNIIMLVNM